MYLSPLGTGVSNPLSTKVQISGGIMTCPKGDLRTKDRPATLTWACQGANFNLCSHVVQPSSWTVGKFIPKIETIQENLQGDIFQPTCCQ